MEQTIREFADALFLLAGIVGALKSSVSFDANKAFVVKVVNVLVGTVASIAITQHFASEFSFGLTMLLSLLAGGSGAMAMEVAVTLVPNLVKEAIKSYAVKILKPPE